MRKALNVVVGLIGFVLAFIGGINAISQSNANVRHALDTSWDSAQHQVSAWIYCGILVVGLVMLLCSLMLTSE